MLIYGISKCLPLAGGMIPSQETVNFYRCLIEGLAVAPGTSSAKCLEILNQGRAKKRKPPVFALEDDPFDIEVEPPPPPLDDDHRHVLLLPNPGEVEAPPQKRRRAGAGPGRPASSGGSGPAEPLPAPPPPPAPPPVVRPPAGPLPGSVLLPPPAAPVGPVILPPPLPVPVEQAPPHPDRVILPPPAERERDANVPDEWLDGLDGARVCFKDYRGYRNWKISCREGHPGCVKVKGETPKRLATIWGYRDTCGVAGVARDALRWRSQQKPSIPTTQPGACGHICSR